MPYLTEKDFSSSNDLPVDFTIDFSEVDAAEVPTSDLVPEGKYDAEVSNVELKTSANSGEQYLNFRFTIKAPEVPAANKRGVFFITSFAPKALDRSISNLFAILGHPVDVNVLKEDNGLEEFVGKTIKIRVVHEVKEDFNNGEPAAKVSSVYGPPIPNGVYKAELVHVDMKQGKTSGLPYISWGFTIEDPTNQAVHGRYVTLRSSLSPKAIKRTYETLTLIGNRPIPKGKLDLASSIPAFVGNKVTVMVEQKEFNGDWNAEVTKVLSPTATVSLGSAPASTTNATKTQHLNF